MLRALGAALRSYRLYERSNPMVERFVAALRQKMEALWETVPELRLQIEEHTIRWEGRSVFTTAESGADLAFIFYKDGIRELTVLPGFEESELLCLLNVLSRAPALHEAEDDLITLLWQEELTRLRYRAVEAGAEGVELYSGSDEAPRPVDPEAVRGEEQAQRVTAGDFQESLYFLEDVELRRLQDEVRRESERDLWRDVLNGLLDRLEDGNEERQLRIVSVVGELLPATLASGQFERAASLLEELVSVAGNRDVLTPAALNETRELFAVMGADETIAHLTGLLEESPDRLNDASVARLLAFFPPRAIGPLMRSAERTQRPAVRRLLEGCIERLAESGRDEIGRLLRADDRTAVLGALQWIGRLKIGNAAGDVVRHLRNEDAGIRAGALDALAALGLASAVNAMSPMLDDPERDVRIAAARALGTLAPSAALPAFETSLASRRLREADRTEKLAFFEAFGRLAGPAGVPALDRILNARSWIGKAETAEYRACAAIGLARIQHPSATASLNAASADKDPVVRAAVMRALREGDE